jgi:DnaJ-class molecular chaperone
MEGWRVNWKDYYDILGVRINTEPEVIKGAYNAMARKFHPDINPAGAARMKAVNEAYEVLSDPLRKADYDAAYKARWHSRYGPGRQDSGSSAGGRRGTQEEETQDPESEGTGEGGGIWQTASSAWRRFRRRNAGRPVYVDHREKIIPWPSRRW